MVELLANYLIENSEEYLDFFLTILDSSFEELKNKMSNFQNIAVETLQNGETISNFPHIFHKIWISDPNNVNQIPGHTQHLMREHIRDTDTSFCNWLWTNVELDISQIQGFEVKNIDEFRNDPEFFLVQAYMNQNMFPFATDVLRLLILRKYGGYYSDIGWIINRDLIPLTRKFEIVINGESYKSTVSHNSIFCFPQNPFVCKILDLISDKNILKNVYDKYGINGIRELTGPRMFTAVLPKIYNFGSKIFLIVPTRPLLIRYHHESWIDGKLQFGVKTISNINNELFEQQIF